MAIPGTQPVAAAPAQPRGRDKLDPRFAAILAQTGVAETHWDTLGTKKCCSAALFGSLAASEAGIHAVLKRILNLDPDNVDDDLFEQGRLTMVWEACKARTAVESRERIERSVAQLAPQITESDFENARRAREAELGYELPEHLVPSRPLFEKLLAQAESCFDVIPFNLVTSFAEQKVHLPGCGSSGVKWDEKSKGFKEEVKDFEVKLPQSAEDLEMRLKILEHVWAMVKMRYGSNPKLASVASVHFARYTDWLKGTQVWNFCIKGKDGAPISCPTIGLILDYDLALRTRQAKLLNLGFDFQDALEKAMADPDLRLQHFMGPFTCSVNTPECRALSAPGISHIYPQLQKARKAPESSGSQATPTTRVADSPLSKTARKKANQAAKKREAEQEAARAAKAAKKNHKGESKGNRKGAPKGGGKGQAPAAGSNQPPPGKRSQTASGQQICFAFNKGTCTRGDKCKFAHESWDPL